MLFEDVTNKNLETLKVMREKGKIKGEIKIYECDSTKIIVSTVDNKKHASISNPYRKVQGPEINAAFKLSGIQLFKLKHSPTGVVHIIGVRGKAPTQ